MRILVHWSTLFAFCTYKCSLITFYLQIRKFSTLAMRKLGNSFFLYVKLGL